MYYRLGEDCLNNSFYEVLENAVWSQAIKKILITILSPSNDLMRDFMYKVYSNFFKRQT